MLIYKENNFLYCFIHIPKTAGKTIRNNIKNKTAVIKEYWGCSDDFDYAHISYALRNKFCKYDKVLYHTYVRNKFVAPVSGTRQVHQRSWYPSAKSTKNTISNGRAGPGTGLAVYLKQVPR